jgi:hypothetical protein
MKRALLAAILSLLPAALPFPARAADPPGADAQADPFAGPPEKSSTEPDEDALLRGPVRPSPPAPSPPPAPPPVVQAPPRPPSRGGRRAAQATDDGRASAAAVPTDEAGGVALELSTSSFASGSLVGGLFVGGRMAGGMILGGFFDYGLQSATASIGGTNITTSTQLFRLGAGLRPTFVRSADRLVELYGAADASFEYRSADLPATGGSSPTASVSAAGLSLALGPGLRLWVHEQIALGYVARFRLTYLSGDAGALGATVSDDQTSGSATSIGFDGTFQILGLF